MVSNTYLFKPSLIYIDLKMDRFPCPLQLYKQTPIVPTLTDSYIYSNAGTVVVTHLFIHV